MPVFSTNSHHLEIILAMILKWFHCHGNMSQPLPNDLLQNHFRVSRVLIILDALTVYSDFFLGSTVSLEPEE